MLNWTQHILTEAFGRNVYNIYYTTESLTPNVSSSLERDMKKVNIAEAQVWVALNRTSTHTDKMAFGRNVIIYCTRYELFSILPLNTLQGRSLLKKGKSGWRHILNQSSNHTGKK